MSERSALVLGAGGVVGHAWHAGVLQGIEDELGWDARQADLVIGTSAGSVVGALLRAGIGAGDLFARATGAAVSPETERRLAAAGIGGPMAAPSRPDFGGRRYRPASAALLARSALTPWRLRPGLLAAGALPRGAVDPGIERSLGGLFPGGWPEAPLWLCAVRLADGRRVVLGREGAPDVPVGVAVAASCAIPGWFAPVPIDGQDHVDGGAHSPTNADLAAAAGSSAAVGAGASPRLAIVSSPMSLDRNALRRPAADRILRVGHRATLLREVTGLRRRGVAVATFQPGPDDLAVMGSGTAAMDPRRRQQVAEQARATVRRRLSDPALRKVLEPLS